MKKYEFLTAVALTEGDAYNWENQEAPVIYDGTGLEDEPEPIEIGFSCNICGHKNTVDIRHIVLNGSDSFRLFREGSSPESLESLVSKFKLKKEESEYGTFYRTAMGFSSFLQFVNCSSCGQQYLWVMGYGEHQPARYLGVLQGIREVSGEGVPAGMKAI